MIKKSYIVGIIIVVAAATTGIISTVIIFQNNIDSRIRSLMAQDNIPSLSAGIIVNDALVWSNGYGNQPDGLDTVYMIGSITKVFTATAIMQLYENGSLVLDADINNYIPFSVRNPNYPGDQITIRHLLAHSSGINNFEFPTWDYDEIFINWSNSNLGWNLTILDPHPAMGEFLNESLNPTGSYYESDHWKNFAPGTDWQYTNFGFLLLAYIVEEITNQSYTEYLQEHVLEPLGMTSTGYNFTDFIGRNAVPYEEDDTQLISGPIYNQLNLGGGALRSTVPDLSKFLIAHMNHGTYSNSQILQPQTVDLMQSSQFSLSGYDFGGAFSLTGQGLGWFLCTDNTIEHGGGIAGYLACIAFKTVSNGKYGILFTLNKGSSIVYDDSLLSNFLPSLINLLFEEAVKLA